MKLSLVDRRGPDVPETAWRPDAAVVTGLEVLLAAVGLPGWRAVLVLVDDEEMAALNHRYRGAAEPTDVLSFSYLEQDGAGRADLTAGRRHAARDLWCDRDGDAGPEDCEVGEIVLAPAFVAQRCAARGWDLEAEWALLVVHGALHLLGWEHRSIDERRAMRAVEAQLLARRGIGHPLRDEPTED
ncbi:MAG: rRNA maturation RNase YbeY [Candidatus Krumholzibacteriia bacterium]